MADTEGTTQFTFSHSGKRFKVYNDAEEKGFCVSFSALAVSGLFFVFCVAVSPPSSLSRGFAYGCRHWVCLS